MIAEQNGERGRSESARESNFRRGSIPGPSPLPTPLIASCPSTVIVKRSDKILPTDFRFLFRALWGPYFPSSRQREPGIGYSAVPN